MLEVYRNWNAAQEGTEIHDIASKLIDKKIKLPRNRKTLNLYVNDCIGYKMVSEQPLFYSDYCFGTADAISFRKNYLRIHDLKTGITPASIEQLEIYAALFCLEYQKEPKDIEIELRIYQNDQVIVHKPEASEIEAIMDKIIEFDTLLDSLDGGEE
jgi:hypothetical protein